MLLKEIKTQKKTASNLFIFNTNTIELIHFTPHPPLPLKGAGLGRE
jgi:hypothetical protein